MRGLNCEFVQPNDFLFFLNKQIETAKEIKIAVAYLKTGGYTALSSGITNFLEKGGRLEIVLGLADYGITDSLPLKKLLALKKKFGKHLNLLFICNRRFHPKLFIFKNNKKATILIGSSNFTGGGFGGNIEANVSIVSSYKNPFVKKVVRFYEHKIKEIAKPLTAKVYEEYHKFLIKKVKKIKRTDLKISTTQIPFNKKRGNELIRSDGQPIFGKKIFAFCTEPDCKRKVEYPTNWCCDDHSENDSLDTPKPTSKQRDKFKKSKGCSKKKNKTIRLLVDNKPLYANKIEVICNRKRCREPLPATNDFYWIICKTHYDKQKKDKKNPTRYHGIWLSCDKNKAIKK